jgi:hypothetical protein
VAEDRQLRHQQKSMALQTRGLAQQLRQLEEEPP